jgi:hypothetical protein
MLEMRWKPDRFLSRIWNLNPRVRRLVFNGIRPESGGVPADFKIGVAAVPGKVFPKSGLSVILRENSPLTPPQELF